MKFLVIRFSSIGDIVLTSPVLRVLKNHFPEAQIHFLTKKQNASVIAANEYVDKVHLLEDSLSACIKTLRQENYDYVIDLHHNLRSFRVKTALRKKSFSFDKLNIQKWLLVNLKINHLPDVHLVDRYLKTLQYWKIENDEKGLDFHIPEDTFLPSFFESSQPFVTLVLGGQYATKRIPYKTVLTICDNVSYPIVLLGGTQEAEEGKTLSDRCANAHNFCGEFNLYQSAKAIQKSALVLTPDTGLMHIAAALKKDIFSIWGNTVPEFGMYPYFPGKQSQIFEIKGLSCRPCSKIGYAQCPKKHFACMQQQNIQKMVLEVNNYMANLKN